MDDKHKPSEPQQLTAQQLNTTKTVLIKHYLSGYVDGLRANRETYGTIPLYKLNTNKGLDK